MSINHLPPTYPQAILSLQPTAQFTMLGDDYDTIQWIDPSVAKPTKEEVETELTRLTAEYNALEYQRLRAEEYPSIEDQLDDLYHNGVDGWKASIQSVKDKYPKPVQE